MRLSHFVAAAALLTVNFAAHADSFTQPLTIVNGDGSVQDSSGFYLVATNPFSQFNPSVGALTSVVASIQGTATAGADGDHLANLRYTYFNPKGGSTSGSTYSPGSFSFTSHLNDSSTDLSAFTGTGANPFRIEFTDPTTNVNATGTVTYNYTAAIPAAATPEPSGLALLGTGVLGVLGVARKRFAQ